jgi:alpha-L-fucosidase
MTIEEVLIQVVTTVRLLSFTCLKLSRQDLYSFVFSTGGNALINVGPSMHGKIPPIFQERLLQMGSWLKVNGEGIYASIPWKFQNDTANPNVW